MTEKKSSSRRPRVSVLGLLLLTTCVALSLGLWNAWQRAERFRGEMLRALDENRRLRDEYGEFEVTDPSLLYAVRMHSRQHEVDQRDWRWRIATPAGKRMTLNYADGTIRVPSWFDGERSSLNLPKPAYSEPLEPGIHSVHLRFEYNPRFPPAKAWRWRLAVQSDLNETRSDRETVRSMAATAWPSLVDDEGRRALFQPSEGLDWGTSQPIGSGRDAFSPDKPLVLQRMRVQTVDRKIVPPTGFPTYEDIPGFNLDADAPGFVIWLEPVP